MTEVLTAILIGESILFTYTAIGGLISYGCLVTDADKWQKIFVGHQNKFDFGDYIRIIAFWPRYFTRWIKK